MRLGYLGLGSNVGDRRANLQAAADALGTRGVRVLASSSTTPVVLWTARPRLVTTAIPALS